MNQKKIGNKFEEEFTDILSRYGFWAHIVAPNPKDGSQPFDVIASKNGQFYAFDCKTCNSNQFPLSRVESNQILAFNKLYHVRTLRGYFAFKTDNGIHLAHSAKIIGLKNQGNKYVDVSVFERLDWWVREWMY